ncbi:hypothetical protein E8E13_005764 [Curvularia kusanoi]|uniref:Arginase n=1 Tax=Curvularia kusanoi TaxID=90978 RepID=A0A9P4W5Q6_CURKU|nr:hypothetical protein E8E13_005764 [Curvularia kusanoi]
MTSSPLLSTVSVTHIPADCGCMIPGTSKAPEAFRAAGLITKLNRVGIATEEHHALGSPARYSVTDFGLGSVRNLSLNVDVCSRVYATLASSISASSEFFPPFHLVIGGEHCQLQPVLAALARSQRYSRKGIGLICINTDLDLSSPTDADSHGYFASMVTTYLLQLPGSLKEMEQYSRPDGRALCDACNMFFLGTSTSNSGNKPEHISYILDHGFEVISSKALASGPEGAARSALAYFQDEVDAIFVHLDVDSIDARLFPLANVPSFTGIGFEEMMRAVSVLVRSQMVCGLMITEVNPDHDPELEMVTRLTDNIVEMLSKRE